MGEMTVKVKTIQAGQPRAYADSIYESELTYSDDEYPDFDPDPVVVKDHAKALVRQFNENEKRGWWEGRLDILEKLGKGKWRVRIIEPYTD